jgi:hypothetical protein
MGMLIFADKKTKILFVCGNCKNGIKNNTERIFKKFFEKALTIQNCFLCLHSQRDNLQISIEFPSLLNLF